MELKEYQTRALDAFERWRDALAAAQTQSETAVAALQAAGVDLPADIRNYPKTAWLRLSESGEVAPTAGPYVDRTADAGFPIPHICFKVPTGGGKTLLAAAALERLNRPTGLVLWMVPSNAIYQQTKAALWSREHSYRQMLERASGGRVKVLEKDTPFTAGDVANCLCVMLVSLQSSNRKNNKDYLKMFRDSGRYPTLFPDSDDALGDGKLRQQYPDLEPLDADAPVKHSLFNVFKMLRPVIVLDEAHKAYGQKTENSDEFVQSINRINPSLVIELSATPNSRRSNLLVDISGVDLKAEEMIKLPVQVHHYANSEWQHTLTKAHAELERLELESVSFRHNGGCYIRPIAVVRVERVGKDQRKGEYVHSEDVREYLTGNLGVPDADVVVHTGDNRGLQNVDLHSEFTSVRWIITKAALMEGWDCSFAYLLVMLDNTQAQNAITQLVGRVMRQPYARRTGREVLDQCYVYCSNTDVSTVVGQVKYGLERQGLTGLDDDVSSRQDTSIELVTIQRRERFQGADIFLPKVLHRDRAGGWIELDYQRHILPGLDLDRISAPVPQAAQARKAQGETATVDVADAPDNPTPAVYHDPQELYIDKTARIAWYARRISDVMPNPFQPARVAGELIQQMRDAGQDDDSIYEQRAALAEQLRDHVKEALDQQAEQVFQAKLANGAIRFDLEICDRNHTLAHSYEIPISDNDVELQRRGQSVQLSLFKPQFARHFNALERRFAFYLDEQKALQWWHRVAVRQRGDYYIQGWRRNRVWPDFVAMAGETAGKASILVFETKGEQLQGNDDTKYKAKLFAALEETFNAGKMTIHDGPAQGVFRLVFDQAGFPDAHTALSRLNGGYNA